MDDRVRVVFVKADEVFSKLMGDDVEPRKLFIAEHASEAQIDI